MERPHPVKRHAVSALTGVVFLGGLYFLGSTAPVLFPGLDEGVHAAPFHATLLVGITAALALFLLGSRFFAEARQRLKPVWHPAVLVWLIPFIGLMVPACIRGRNSTGFPLPGNRGGHDEPWDSIFAQVMPEAAPLILCACAVAFLIARMAQRPPKGVIRVALLAVFTAECLRSVHIGLFDYFGASTWGAGEMLEEILFPNLPVLFFWLGLALVPAWRIVGEMVLQPSHPLMKGRAARGILKAAFGLAAGAVCGVFLLCAATARDLPSVSVLKSADGLKTLLKGHEGSALEVRLTPLREAPPHVASVFTTYYGERNSFSTDLVHTLPFKKGYSDLKGDVAYFSIRFFLSREEILSAWLATRSFGKGVLGPATAAERYFNKPFAELDLCEAAMLAPISYDPYSNPIADPAGAKKRQRALLDDMAQLGLISEADRERCQTKP